MSQGCSTEQIELLISILAFIAATLGLILSIQECLEGEDEVDQLASLEERVSQLENQIGVLVQLATRARP